MTPVSQAGILHGSNDDMPGFRWFEKPSKTLLVANTPAGAAEIVRRRSNGHGLLADDGASIGNLVTGDAPRSYVTMATVTEERPADGDPRRLRGVFVSQVNYIRLAVLTIGELVKEVYQRERQRGRAIEPRIPRDSHYAFERALTNVSLRNLTTALVIEEMFHGAPTIYVDYTGYDALAHHVGPERAEAVDALDGLDRTIGSLIRAGRETPRPYRMRRPVRPRPVSRHAVLAAIRGAARGRGTPADARHLDREAPGPIGPNTRRAGRSSWPRSAAAAG